MCQAPLVVPALAASIRHDIAEIMLRPALTLSEHAQHAQLGRRASNFTLSRASFTLGINHFIHAYHGAVS
jgi:hypothetical protein